MKTVLVLLLVFPFLLQAQKNHPFTEAKEAISFSPLALAQIDYTALFGYENKLRNKLYFSMEAGYIFASGYVSNMNDRSQRGRGFLLRPSIKWFLSTNNKFYLQPQVFYKQVTHKLHDWLGKNAVNGVPSYEQMQDFRYRRKVVGFNTVAGFALPLDQHRNGYIDFYFGLGFRVKKNLVVGEPNSVYQESSVSFIAGGFASGIFPSLPAGMRLVYAIR